MEAGTEKGCIFKERGQGACNKLVERGTLMCPHHNLVLAYQEQQQAEKERAKREKGVQRGR